MDNSQTGSSTENKTTEGGNQIDSSAGAAGKAAGST